MFMNEFAVIEMRAMKLWEQAIQKQKWISIFNDIIILKSDNSNKAASISILHS